MLLELIIGIAASLIASIITGFLGNKAISKKDSVILKIYVLFLAATVFVISAFISVMLNESFVNLLASMKGFDIRQFYIKGFTNIMFIFLMVTLITAGVILAEAVDRSSRRDHKEDMDRWKAMK